MDLSHVHFTDEQFYQLCINNPELQLERDRNGVLIVMSPVGGDGGNQEADYIIDLGTWNRQTNGVRLGWLFNPQDQQVEIYRRGHDKEVRSLPTELSGEKVLPGFVLSVDRFPDDDSLSSE